MVIDKDLMQDLARQTVPRWWQSRKGMAAVIVLAGYVVAPLVGKPLPAEFAELARIVVVALFLTANGEHTNAKGSNL